MLHSTSLVVTYIQPYTGLHQNKYYTYIVNINELTSHVCSFYMKEYMYTGNNMQNHGKYLYFVLNIHVFEPSFKRKPKISQ